MLNTGQYLLAADLMERPLPMQRIRSYWRHICSPEHIQMRELRAVLFGVGSASPPQETPALYGRESFKDTDDCTEIESALQIGDNVILTGDANTGKTQFVLAVSNKPAFTISCFDDLRHLDESAQTIIFDDCAWESISVHDVKRLLDRTHATVTIPCRYVSSFAHRESWTNACFFWQV